MNLKKDDYIVYRSAGVCQIVEVAPQSMDGVHTVLYYKLKPISDPNSTYYIPAEHAEDKLRNLLTEEEVLALIDAMPHSDEEDSLWSDNRRERKEMYAQIMKGDDHYALIRMISSLYFRKQFTEKHGKRFSTMDESAMKNAENLMLQEFGFVLKMNQETLRKFIAARVDTAMNQ